MGEIVILNLSESAAERARQVASQSERRVEDVLIEWLDREAVKPQTETLPHAEAELLQRINIGFSEEWWKRYHALVAKRRAETLAPNEHQELMTLTDQLENANARRIANLIELAKLRNSSLDALMRDLDISAPAYA